MRGLKLEIGADLFCKWSEPLTTRTESLNLYDLVGKFVHYSILVAMLLLFCYGLPRSFHHFLTILVVVIFSVDTLLDQSIAKNHECGCTWNIVHYSLPKIKKMNVRRVCLIGCQLLLLLF